MKHPARQAARTGSTSVPASPPSSVGTLASVILLSVCTAFPALLVAALAVPIRTDLEFGPGLLGASVAVFFAVTSVLSRPLGALARKIGTRRGLALAGTVASMSLFGLAVARSPVHLIGALVLAGGANALAHPSVNTVLSRLVSHTRKGLAFGIKQAAAPIAGLLGGIAVPVIAVTLGWRWVLVIAAVAALGNVAFAWRREGSDPDARQAATPPADASHRQRTPSLLAYSVAAGLGAAGANSVVVFLVDGGVTAVGFSVATAASVFAVANVASIVIRIGAGMVVDRTPGRARSMICLMLVMGTVGCAMLAASSPTLFVVGAVVAAGIGWGWTGLMHYVVVIENADRPEVATGALLTGFGFGSASGPILLGQIAARLSYPAVWAAAGVLCLASALVVAFATYRAGRHAPARR